MALPLSDELSEALVTDVGRVAEQRIKDYGRVFAAQVNVVIETAGSEDADAPLTIPAMQYADALLDAARASARGVSLTAALYTTYLQIGMEPEEVAGVIAELMRAADKTFATAATPGLQGEGGEE